MCMEDVRIGRKTLYRQTDVVTTGASQAIIQGSPKRTVLILPAPLTGQITYSLENPAAAGKGINLQLGSGAVILNVQDHGALVTAPWFGFASAAALNLGVIEGILQEE